MTITPKFKPGQLVRYRTPAMRPPFVGLVKSTRFARRRGDPEFVLVQWCCARNLRLKEEYIPQSELRLVEDV